MALFKNALSADDVKSIQALSFLMKSIATMPIPMPMGTKPVSNTPFHLDAAALTVAAILAPATSSAARAAAAADEPATATLLTAVAIALAAPFAAQAEDAAAPAPTPVLAIHCGHLLDSINGKMLG